MTTKHTISRRTALAGAVTLPAAMAPLGFARTATTPNATDAVWAELEAAEAKVRAVNATAGDATDEEIDAVLDAYNPAVDAVLAAPVATMTDVERKLAASEHYYRGSMVPHELLSDLLAQVCASTGRAV